jgi:hypothetical protein
MEFHEVAATFELGRRWFQVHYKCTKPVSPVIERKTAFDDFLSMAHTLSIPINARLIPSPVQAPAKFADVASDVFATSVLTPALIARGQIAASVLQCGSLYTQIALSRGSAGDLNRALSALKSEIQQLGVPPKDAETFVKALRQFQSQPKKAGSEERDLAVKLGNLLATAISSAKGLQVGNVVLPNTILLPSKDQITLPKRLVGYKTELEQFLKNHPYDRNVFLMMPFRDATTKLRTSIRSTCAKYKLHLLIADETHIVENDLNSNVLSCLLGSKYGIAVFSRPESQQTVNPNVSYELGMMHRDDKVCLILKDRRLRSLPADLIGYLYTEYAVADQQSLVSHVELWIQDRVIC